MPIGSYKLLIHWGDALLSCLKRYFGAQLQLLENWVYTYFMCGFTPTWACLSITPALKLHPGLNCLWAHLWPTSQSFCSFIFLILLLGDSKHIFKLKIEQKAVYAPCVCGEPWLILYRAQEPKVRAKESLTALSCINTLRLLLLGLILGKLLFLKGSNFVLWSSALCFHNH